MKNYTIYMEQDKIKLPYQYYLFYRDTGIGFIKSHIGIDTNSYYTSTEYGIFLTKYTPLQEKFSISYSVNKSVFRKELEKYRERKLIYV